MTLTNIRFFKSNNIDTLNEKLWRDIYYEGDELLFGDEHEPKKAKEIFAVVQLYGNALERLYNGDVPNGWMFRGSANKVYIDMLKDPERGDQPYTYGERLHRYLAAKSIGCFEDDGTVSRSYTEVRVNQLENAKERLREDIRTGIQSNRNCGVIWNPLDIFLNSPACFQWYQVRKSDKNNVSLRVLFRSHAYDNANFANWGAILRVFIDEVITPAGGVLEELICVSVSAGMEYSNFDMVEALVGNIPEHIRRLMK